MLANFHTHTLFCDGHDSVYDMAEFAFSSGFTHLGFSSHAPLPFDARWAMKEERISSYIKEIEDSKKSFSKMKIFTALEVDYIPSTWEYSKKIISDNKFDYLIGAVHLLGEPDGKDYITITGNSSRFADSLTNSGKDIISAVREYYERMIYLIRYTEVDVIAHFDLIKKVNIDFQIFDENASWYNDFLNSALDALAANPKIVEVNTGALSRKKSKDLFPSDYILRFLLKNDIPVVINSDCHRKKDIAAYYDFACDRLKSLGFTYTMIYDEEGWIKTPL
ncbi:MAG TPA: histidinol-phosphatase [Spirochaetota bacterium]|nr:histidinol-phosphatase [Spirochaetota bacterium]HQO23032.1 histidinol-phosphatase [Spirochaetota bacterium]